MQDNSRRSNSRRFLRVAASSNSVFNYVLLTGGDINNSGGTIDSANFTNMSGSSVQGFLTFTGNFTNNGVLAPGNSPGLTTIAGDYTENAILQAQVQTTTPITGHDQVRVGGTVTLNPTSTLNVQPWGGAAPTYGNVYQIIADSTGGIKRATGSFGDVQFDTSGNATGTYAHNAAVVFDVNTGQLIATGLNAANSTFAGIGATPSQRTAATALMSVATGDVGRNQIDSLSKVGGTAYALLTANGNAASANIARMTPEYYGGMANFALLSTKTVTDFLYSRSSPVGKSDGKSAGDGKVAYVGYMTNKYDVSAEDVSRNDFYVGLEGGSDALSLGLLLTKSDGSISAAFGRGSADGVGATAYLRKTVNPALSILGSLGYSAYTYHLDRSAVVGTASASVRGSGLNAGLGVTYLAYDENDVSVRPHVGITYGSAAVDGFQETGSDQRLSISGFHSSRLSVQAGAMFARSTQINGRNLELALDLGMDSAISDRKGDMDSVMVADTRVKFPISFASEKKSLLSVGLSANYEMSRATSVYVKYEAKNSGNSGMVVLKSSF